MKKILRHGRILTSSSPYYDPIIYTLGNAFSTMPDTSTYAVRNPNYPEQPHGISASLNETIPTNRYTDICINSYWQKIVYTLSLDDLSHFSVKVQITNGQLDESMTEFLLDNSDNNCSTLTTWISVNISSTSTWTFSICYDNVEIVRASGTLYAN